MSKLKNKRRKKAGNIRRSKSISLDYKFRRNRKICFPKNFKGELIYEISETGIDLIKRLFNSMESAGGTVFKWDVSDYYNHNIE